MPAVVRVVRVQSCTSPCGTISYCNCTMMYIHMPNYKCNFYIISLFMNTNLYDKDTNTIGCVTS
jgi:hypothetical protein